MPKRFLKIVKIAKKKMPWIEHLIEDEKTASDILPPDTTFQVRGSMCVACKGGRMLCGKLSCPLIVRVRSYLKVANTGREVSGSSPPGVFVGRMGYPYVYAGPLVPPIHEDTSLYDYPEEWIGMGIEEIVNFRMQLIRGKKRVKVTEPKGKVIESMQELALSKSPTDVEMKLLKRPSKHIIMDDEVQPIGPSAPLQDVDVSSAKTNQKIEKAFGDDDLKAKEAVLELYNSKVPLSSIQKGLSAALFGLRDNRRLVPTRWSITSVDSMISQDLMDEVKDNQLINDFLLHEFEHLDNRFAVLMIPDAWSYELMEAWYPGTVWNPRSRDIFMFGDSEKYWGRTTYASIGGCYYAARLAVGEHLVNEGRQARVVIMREARPGYIMPVGVWNVRESVREALKKRPEKFESLNEALKSIGHGFEIPLETWVKNSALLKDSMVQRKITEWIVK